MNPYVLKKPVITEKTLYLASATNVYTFEVMPTASRLQIAQAVQQTFGVHVVSVNTVMRAVSTKRTGRRRQSVSIPRTKKALVRVKQGQTIALFDIQQMAQTTDAAKTTAETQPSKPGLRPVKSRKQTKTKA
jgi:large subunit ribosomal protein L23